MRLRRLLQLHEGEGRTVALAVTAAFLSSGGTLIAQSAIDALFFTQYGVDRLPTLYLVLGPTMFVAMAGVGLLLARLGRGRAFVAIPAAILLIALAGRAALATDAGWVVGGLWVVRNVAEMLQVLAVWGLAGLITDTRQAKRFFPLIAAGGIFGLIIGGFATRPLAVALGPENLVAVWAAAVGCVVVLSWRLVSRAGGAPRPPRLRRHRRDANVVHFVRRSPLLSSLAVGSFLTAALFSLLYLPFSGAAVERYPNPDDLAGFFGTFFALATGTAFVLSLFVTSRLLRRFGVPMMVVVLPLVYVAAFGVLTVAATFAALTFFRFVQVAWSGGGGNSAWEALVNAVPANRRDQIRAFLYGVPTQLGTIAAGVIALAAQSLSQPRVLYISGLAGAVLAALAIARVRRAYPAALVEALREGRPDIFGGAAALRTPASEPDARALAILQEGLADRDARVRQLAAHGLGEVGSPSAVEALSTALVDPDAPVRVAAIDALAAIGLTSPRPVLAGLTDDELDVRLASVRALATVEAIDAEAATALKACLADSDARVRAYAAACLLRHGADGSARAVLTRSARSSRADDRVAVLDAIRFVRPAGLEDLVVAAFDDEAPVVRASAIRAVRPDGATGTFARLVQLLASDDAAVAQEAAEALCSMESDGAMAAMAKESAARWVADAVRDHELASSLRVDTPPRRLLHDSLLARAQRRAVHALRAVAVLGRESAVVVALENLPATDPAQRANAIEVIDTVGVREIVRPLLVLWEPEPARQRRDVDCLDELRKDPDDWIRACAEWAASSEGSNVPTTLPTVPLLERVVFLRAVPLFAELAPQDLRPIAEIVEEHEFMEGETIAEKGEAGDATYIIVSGEVEVSDTVDGRDVLVGVRAKGEVIGEMSVLSNRPRMASLVARSPARVLVIGRSEFQSILRERPETALALMRVLCDRLEDRSQADTPVE